MKKTEKGLQTLIFIMVLLPVFTITAYAEGWVWLTEARPWHILPYALIGCILIEALLIRFVGKTESLTKTLLCTALFNIISCAIPYIYHILIENYGQIYSADIAFGSSYFYHVGKPYALITLCIEIPAVYKLLRNLTDNHVLLACAVAGSNFLTSAAFYALERTFCYGSY